MNPLNFFILYLLAATVIVTFGPEVRNLYAAILPFHYLIDIAALSTACCMGIRSAIGL